jgi:hypothetical protein
MAARHLLRAGDYLSAINYGFPDEFWWSFVLRLEELMGAAPVFVSKPEHPPYHDGEALGDWQLRFMRDDKEYIVVLRDARFVTVEGENSDVDLIRVFKERRPQAGVVIVSNSSMAKASAALEFPPEFIMDADPLNAAQIAFSKLTS